MYNEQARGAPDTEYNSVQVKHFDKTIALAEYHTRGLYSAVILTPREHVTAGLSPFGVDKK